MPPRRTQSIALMSAASRSTPTLSITFSCTFLGSRPSAFCGGLGDRRAVRLHADGVDHRVRAAAVGQLADPRRPTPSTSVRSIVSAPRPWTRRQPLAHGVDDDDPQAAVQGDPGRHVADRAGADDQQRAALLDVGVLDGLPRRGQDVGEEEEAVVRRAVRHLDRQRVAERHAQHLGLAAGHLAVELAVAEEARAGAGVAVLGGLALAVAGRASHIQQVPQLMLNGTTTRSPGLQGRDRGADLAHDAHRLVADDVARRHERRQRVVEVQVGAAQPGRGDLDDDVGRLLDDRVGDLDDLHVLLALPRDCLHRSVTSWVRRAVSSMRAQPVPRTAVCPCAAGVRERRHVRPVHAAGTSGSQLGPPTRRWPCPRDEPTASDRRGARRPRRRPGDVAEACAWPRRSR